MKRRIKLTESDLHRIIKKNLRMALRERVLKTIITVRKTNFIHQDHTECGEWK